VQSADDVESLQEALEEVRPGDWRRISLVLKIETPRAVRNLPELIVRAAARQPAAVMIARGDLAIEMGFTRLAEMQEEILWIAEAARIPVIWATQVMENLVKTGAFSRGEMTDAAMAARAECVMLNKGPHLMKALGELTRLLGRMDAHIHKKTPQMRRLTSW
jgi:pyruvate kinase